DGDDVLLVGVGVFAELAVAAAGRLANQGIGVTVVDPRWVLPGPAALVRMAARHRLVVSVEDGGRHGGFGWSLAAALRDAEIDVPCRDLGIPQRFLAHGSRDEVLTDLGLTAQGVARAVTGWMAGVIRTIGEPVAAHTSGGTV
ncbi:MAG: transketolase C-terminal domain-containing protein, partial [Pseudonocardiaceae bacterium]